MVKRIMSLVLGAAMLLGLAATARPAEAASSGVGMSGSMQIKDDEYWNDEYCNRTFSQSGWLMYTNQYSSLYGEGRCGGEVRIEVHATARMNSNGSITFLSPRVDLYEGTSESTGDLDGRKYISNFTVAEGQSVSKYVYVENTAEGGDWAKVWVTFANL